MSVFDELGALEFIASGEVTIEDSDDAWVRLNVEKANSERIDQYLKAIIEFLRKLVKARIWILKSASNIIVNLPMCF